MADKKISALTAATTPLAGTEVLPIVQSGSTVKVSVSNLTAGRAISASSVGAGVASPAYPLDVYAGAGGTLVNLASASSATAQNGVSFSSTGGAYANSFYLYNGNLVAGGFGWALYDVTAGATRFSVSNAGNFTVSTGNLVVGTAGKGIDFSANTHAAGMTSELLNYYEEGTWTPNSNFGWTDSGTVTRTGTYTRVGRQVFVTIKIATSGGGSVAMNQANISNLPYTAANPAIGGWGVVSNYGATTQTQNVLVDGAVMYFTGSWPAVANYTYTATVTYTV